MHIGIRVWPRTPVPAGGPQTKYSQGCEPKTESRFFRSVFLGFSRPKTDFLESVFRLPKKNKPKNRLDFFRSFFFPIPYANNAYISVMKPRYVWTVLQPP